MDVAVAHGRCLGWHLVLVVAGRDRELLGVEALVEVLRSLNLNVSNNLNSASVPAEQGAREVGLHRAEEEGDVGTPVANAFLDGEEAGDLRAALEQLGQLDSNDTHNRILLANPKRQRREDLSPR